MNDMSVHLTIPTRTQAMLRDVVETSLAIGRLSIARGRAGIGKSFALETIAAELTQAEDEVLLITADAGNSGSDNKFFSHALLALGIMGNGASAPMDRLAGYLLRSFPFRGHGPRKVLVVDEAQHLPPNLIECLRAIYDQGDEARNFDRNQPACGLVLVGNDRFLSRGGRSERAAFEALLTRADEYELTRPDRDELAELAALRFPTDAALRDELVAFGMKHGNFRQPDRAVDLARHFAGGGKVELSHLRQAMLVVGGR